MKKLLWLALLLCIFTQVSAQTFEVSGLQESYHGVIGETIKAPLLLKNTSDKPIFIVIRRTLSQIGSTQKNYYCFGNNCQETKVDDFHLKIEPGQVISSLNIILEAGLAQGISSVKYLVFNQNMPGDGVEFDLNFVVDEKVEKPTIYTSNHFILHDVYPNPVTEFAFIEYKVLNERVEAKMVLHNILGNTIEEYPLPATEQKVKIKADLLDAGIYFYTVYLDNEGVITRKLIVKK